MTKKKTIAQNKITQELEDRLKRTLADYQNLERRIEEERRLLSRLSSVLLIEKFLPILDNLENAQKHLNDQGLELVIKQFKDVLATEGVEEILSEGQDFDPKFHEAIEAENGREDNKVVKVAAKGYKIEDKIIRPAKVVVSKVAVSHPHEDEDEIPVQVENDGTQEAKI